MNAAVLQVAAGTSAVVGGVGGIVVGRRRWRYAVLLLAGACLVASWATHDPASSVRVRDVGAALGPMAPGLAVVAVLVPQRSAWVALAGALVAGPLHALVHDPFLDLTCTDCRPSTVVVAPHTDLARVLAVGGPVLAIAAVALAVWGSGGGRAHRAPASRAGQDRWAAGPLLLLLPGLLVALWGLAPGGALASLAAAVVVVLDDRRALVAQRRLEDLVETLRSGRGFAEVLREGWGEDSIEVSYWVADEGGWVDPQGLPRPAPGTGATALRWAGTVTAAVSLHGASGRTGLPDLESALDVPARLVLDNERLSAALAARVRRVSAARALVVELGDRERRRIERDLHDGVQQQLLALGLDLRGALATLPQGSARRLVLEDCLDEAIAALEDLRGLTRGLYPPLLATSGLGPALRSLGRRSAVPLTLGCVPDRRLAAPVERAVYAVVSDALARGRASGVAVEIGVDAGLAITLRVVGGPPDAAGVLPDMVEALGGRLHHAGDVLTVLLPSGS